MEIGFYVVMLQKTGDQGIENRIGIDLKKLNAIQSHFLLFVKTLIITEK